MRKATFLLHVGLQLLTLQLQSDGITTEQPDKIMKLP